MTNFNQSKSQLHEDPPLDPLMAAVASRDADVLTLVEDALAHKRARIALQAIYVAGQMPTIAFYEGLIRVTDDAGRIISAGHFMGLVEETALGRQIDCVALDLALKLLSETPFVRLSINVSARSIADGQWRRILDKGLRRDPNVGERLIFEISETSATLLHEVVIRFMSEMQPHGVAFALDGFGAGVIAFRRLKDFFFDLVKIDKSFIRGIPEDSDNQVLTEALISVAHQFEMFVVADGIETQVEADYVTRMGVDCMQGFHFGIPKFGL